MSSRSISEKASRVLLYILVAFFLILIRMWYLSIVARDTYVELSKKPQQKLVREKPLRGTIIDRFNLPLAINRLQYDACICYDRLKTIPSVKRIKDAHGKIIKIYPRREYIQTLSRTLADMLHLDALDIEDTFYGKAALFPTLPFTIQENLPEKLYYTLKGLERTHPGIVASKTIKRTYPQKKVAADLIGYLGAIHEKEYLATTQEIQSLEEYLEQRRYNSLVFLPKGFSGVDDVKTRLRSLKNKRYQLNDALGKTGLEAKFEPVLRGVYGKKLFEIDTKGSILRTLPGSKKPLPGEKLVLNLSSELQEFAEALLAENEFIREQRFSAAGKNHHLITPPWIKGGAIVAMIPSTGEVVALASYPRIDGNDFLEHRPDKIAHWLENTTYIASLWDGKIPLEREFYSFAQNRFYSEEKILSLDHYLDGILSLHSAARKTFLKLAYLENALLLQKNLLTLLDLSEQPHMHALIDTLYPHHKQSCFNTKKEQKEMIQQTLIQHDFFFKDTKAAVDKVLDNFTYNDDKLLVIDLARLIAPYSVFDSLLLENLPQETLKSYRDHTQAFATLHEALVSSTKTCFHTQDFRKWREINFKSYLTEKRKEEKQLHKSPKPYIDYLKTLEKEQFQKFWEDNKWSLIELLLCDAPTSLLEASQHLLPYSSIFQEKLSVTPSLAQARDTLKTHLKKLSTPFKLSYLKTLRRYSELSEKLFGFYPQLKTRKNFQTEKDLAGAFYPASGYGHGRSFGFRQATPLGSIFKVITAYEAIRQSQGKEGVKDLNPLTIIDELQPSPPSEGLVLGLHEDGTKITRRYKGGILPRTHAKKLGKIDYMKAFQRSSNIYFSLLASDVIQDPNDLSLASLKFGFGNKTGIDLPGEIPGVLPKDLQENRSGLYAFAIGQHSLIATPLQTAVMLSSLANGGEVLKPQILQKIEGLVP
ncbi:MAG: hypothetical protein FJZ63_01315, partial [Chlamydiae bacterium]|nr:hypothetical protein [Chlamydiota bacterium]